MTLISFSLDQAHDVTLEQKDEWFLKRRYMQLEALQSPSEAAPTRLPAVQR